MYNVLKGVNSLHDVMVYDGLNLISSYTGVGKTTLALNMAATLSTGVYKAGDKDEVLKHRKESVLFVETTQNLYQEIGIVWHNKITEKPITTINKDQIDELNKMYDIRRFNLYNKNVSTENIMRSFEAYLDYKPLSNDAVIVIDNIHNLADRKDPYYSLLDITSELDTIGKELNIPIIATAQLVLYSKKPLMYLCEDMDWNAQTHYRLVNTKCAYDKYDYYIDGHFSNGVNFLVTEKDKNNSLLPILSVDFNGKYKLISIKEVV